MVLYHFFYWVNLYVSLFLPWTLGYGQHSAMSEVEAAGYEGRNISAGQSPNWTTGPYILQSLTLLLGPTLLAASIYMTLGRLIRLLDADSYSPIRTNWLTKVFVLGDELTFLTQSGGT